MRVIVQVGWQKTKRDGQKLSATVNGDEINWDTFPGRWLTPMSDREWRCWHLCELDLETGDQITIQCKTGLRRKGKDEDRTFDMIYVVGTDTDDVEEVVRQGVGYSNYPLIKGRVQTLADVSEADRRQRGLEQFLDMEF